MTTTTLVTETPNQDQEPPVDRPRYPLSKAAQMAGVSHSTMKRRLRDGSFPGAIRNVDGAWLLSVEDLLGAGLTLRGPGQVTDQVHVDVTPDPDLVERITVLERLLAVETVKREAAEQVAHEREKRAETAERALLMLEARPVEQTRPARWWRRRAE